MLSKNKIQEVILASIFKHTTPDAANNMARALELAPGSVVFGDKAIAIIEDGTTRHFIIATDGRNIVEVDPALL